MAEPEIQPDAGTGTEQPAEVEAVVDEITETPAGDSAAGDGESDDAQSQRTEQASGKVPYDRFYKVNEKRKTLELENAELKRQIEASRSKKEEASLPPQARLKKVLKPAPEGLSTLEQMEYYNLESLEAHLPELLQKWFEKNIGMKPEAAAATLTHTTATTRSDIISKYEAAARARGLDPRNPGLQDAVGVLMDSGRYRSFDEAMDTFRPAQTAGRPAQKPINGKGAEVDSIDLSAASRVRAIPTTTAEAVKLASQGKRVEHVSVVDILSALKDGAP